MPVWLIIVLSVLVLGGVGVGIFIAIKPKVKRCSTKVQTKFVSDTENLIDSLIQTLDNYKKDGTYDFTMTAGEGADSVIMDDMNSYHKMVLDLAMDGPCYLDSKTTKDLNDKIGEYKSIHPQFAADFPTF